MKIAFNLDYDHTNRTGIGRYGIELISAWIKAGMDCELWMLRNTKGTELPVEGAESRIKYYPFPRRITDHFWPSMKALISGATWIHSANGILLPPGPFFRQIAMVHDLTPFLYGHMKAEKDTEPWKKRLRSVAKKADCITVNSNSTMQDLLNFFPFVEGKVFLTPLGIDHFSTTHSPYEKRDHILAVGTVEPRKNIDGLLKAYSVLLARRDIPPLVIAGMDGFRAEEYKRLSLELGIEDRVRFTGYVSDKELSDLYARAYCLVHPAHHEGFGFTVPEAFTWGLPVVASNTGGLGEFFSETAWMVDPEDLESIAHGIELALSSGVTAEQEQKRKELSRELTWENCARKTMEAMKAITS
ncbi:MAG: glycosyltransferase family 4 protein [Candidatus Sabulitectum sp.]|nr:glycosyltransferase family 4 protein [Candidatus Sabulitectum sp.]